ncbi:MAG: response regulator [Povalibacter sp.]
MLLLPVFVPASVDLSGERSIGLNDLKRVAVGSRVHVTGVVTFVDREARFFYLQDQIAGVRIEPDSSAALPAVGDTVDLRAAVKLAYETEASGRKVALTDIRMDRVRHSELPVPDSRSLADLFSDGLPREAIRVETGGIVRAMRRDGSYLLLEIGDNGRRVPVRVLNGQQLSRDSLLDARVRIQGVVQTDHNPWERSFFSNDAGPLLQVASANDVHVLEAAPKDVQVASSIRALLTDPTWVSRGHRVRVHGTVLRQESPQVIVIEIGGMSMPVETASALEYRPGDVIEATGWPTIRRFTVTLQRAEVKAAQVSSRPPDAQLSETLPLMTSSEAIRRLPNEVAARAYPVDVTAVLTAIHYQRDSLIMQSGNVGIYVDATDQSLERLSVGSRVRVRGVTWPGGFAPVITHPQIEYLGPAALPTPVNVDPGAAASGVYDSRYVQIEGLVRPLQKTPLGYQFNLVTPVGLVGVVMVRNDDASLAESLVDARTRLRGVFSSTFNNERVLTGYRLYLDSPQSIEVLDSSPTALSIPLKPINELLRFSGDDQGSRRVRVRGMVTLKQADKLYVQDETGSLRIESADAAAQLGDSVEAVGYPTPNVNGTSFSDAVIRVLDSHVDIEPRSLSAPEVLTGNVQNKLVTIEARLLNQVSGSAQQILVLRDGYSMFNALLSDAIPLGDLREGSIVRVTGVTDVQQQRVALSTTSTAVSFRLLLRSPNDVELVRAAPWWNLRHAWPALALLVLLICISMLWVIVLRRRVQAQTAQIEEQRAFLRNVIDLTPNYIFVKDRAGRFTLANRAIAHAYGCEPHEMIGKTDADIAVVKAEAELHQSDDHEVLESGQDKIVRDECRTDVRGARHFMQTTRRPILADDGLPTHVLGIANDVTLHKEAENTLHRAREAAEAANRAKSEFLANMSHEIRTPLNGILGMSGLCLDTDLSREQREYVETVKLSADGLLNVINDILDFSKIEAGRLELDPIEFDVREALDITLKMLALRAHQKGLELVCDIDPSVPASLVGDANRLRQVVLNLVGNAIKFTERGEVVMRARVASSEGDQYELHFVVADTGIGIAPDRREHIFNPFVQADSSTTRRYGGTGLGLTISSALVKMMGGRIWVDSELGQGSQFHFTLRLNRTHTLDNAAGSPELQNLHALVVDDNAANRRALRNALLHWNVRSSEARNVSEAMAQLEQFAISSTPIRIVITDLDMPESDGLRLLTIIRERPELAAVPIMLLSSSKQREDVERCRQADVSSYVVKPVRASELRDTLVQALSARSHRSVEPKQRIELSSGGLNILVAEDNPVNQLVMQRLLVKRGHRVVIASDGKAALDAVQCEVFDLVFMDVQMPVIDGFQATREIRRNEAGSATRTPIIALTAHAMSGDRERCLQSGMDAYMTKPVVPKELDEMLKLFETPESGVA